MSTVTNSLHVCSFESRRADVMRALIERPGVVATVAPSMRELPLEENHAAFDFAESLLCGRIDVVIFLTGIGARTLLEAVCTRHDRERIVEAIEGCCTIVRGPKPTAVLREWNIRIDHRAPEPNTWREILTVIDAESPVDGRTVAVQEYGEPNHQFYRELQRRAANVVGVPVYCWALPGDCGPLRRAIASTIAGEFRLLLFTSANQLNNVLRVAESDETREPWLAAARSCLIASIGPTCSEAIRAAGLPVSLEASHPQMGHLVKEALQAAAAAT